jgi:hypothetical protein
MEAVPNDQATSGKLRQLFIVHEPQCDTTSLEHKSEKCRLRCTDSEPAETSTFYAQ